MTDWNEIARKQRRRQLLAAGGLLVIGALLIAGGLAVAAAEDGWFGWLSLALGAVLIGLVAGTAMQRLGAVPRRLQPVLVDTDDALAAVPQQPGRAVFGAGTTALAWLIGTVIVTIAAGSEFPLILVLVMWFGLGAFVLLMLVSIRWRIADGGAEQTIDYRVFGYTDRIERIDVLSYQDNKNWLWVHGPATRTWSVFGRPGTPSARSKTVLVLAEFPDRTLAEVAAAVERHTGRSIQVGPLPGEFG